MCSNQAIIIHKSNAKKIYVKIIAIINTIVINKKQKHIKIVAIANKLVKKNR